MSQENKVTVWNATGGVVKVGTDKALLHPGESMEIAMDEATQFLINEGKVVVTSVATYMAPQEESPRKKKKEAPVIEETIVEESVTVEQEEVQPDANAEDLIVHEEMN